ncbi:CYTH and CHAD domain-containing protein [Luteococcus sp. Sow4_B9]|uniref:CYTH and CHAD domain-containing protein n=1 Tax=Luteococcus sp. Sow4_B9 TaxID=3438792 RepID=UPI003F9E16BA
MALEIERKFRLPEGAPITELGEVAALRSRREMSLRATYFDTPGLDLARAGITLRRRTGGHDEGWHLKLPATGDARQEIAEPIVEGSSELQVPGVLRARVVDVIGQAPLAPIAQMDTERAETTLTSPDGAPLALLCEDAVTVTRAGQVQQWREVEVELTQGDEQDLERISQALVERGATAQPQVSKLVQALGDLLSARSDEPLTAAQVVGAYIAAQVGVLQARQEQVREDAPDAVHKMRVATRRLRSTLKTFRDLLDRERTDALLPEIKWLADQLGGPRDAEVLRDRLNAAAAALPDELVHGPVRERMGSELEQRHAHVHAELVAAMDSPRHAALLDELVRLVQDPPFLPAAHAPAEKSLPKPLRKAGRRVVRLWDAAQQAGGEECGELAHEARKKAKACRYAWEAVVPAFGNAKQAAAAWEAVTETLGSAQDSVVARERLLELAEVAQGADEPTFSYGVLYALELGHQDDAHGEADEAIRRARKESRL